MSKERCVSDEVQGLVLAKLFYNHVRENTNVLNKTEKGMVNHYYL